MQTRQLVALIITIAVLALALGVTIGYSLSSGRTTTYTATGSNLYEVEFVQQAATCPPSIPMYVAPWTVTLGNQSKTEPSNETGTSAGWSSSYGVYSKIAFLVPNGVYDYNATPDDNGYTPFQVSPPAKGAYGSVIGSITVSGSNVSVEVGPAEVYCTAATTTQTTPYSTTRTNITTGETFHIPTNGTLTVYARYYYFNSTAADTFDFSNATQIHLEGFDGHSTFDELSNSTVESNVSAIRMGGPENQSEGVAVKYVIGLKPGLNGTYTLNFGWLYPSLSACAVDFHLAVGSGLPNYDWTGGCTAPLSNFYPVNNQGFVPGYLFAEIVNVST